ncbi:MAG: hypothetical protein ACRDRO_04080 [Pseudonocardiaceae bacterium]
MTLNVAAGWVLFLPMPYPDPASDPGLRITFTGNALFGLVLIGLTAAAAATIGQVVAWGFVLVMVMAHSAALVALVRGYRLGWLARDTQGHLPTTQTMHPLRVERSPGGPFLIRTRAGRTAAAELARAVEDKNATDPPPAGKVWSLAWNGNGTRLPHLDRLIESPVIGRDVGWPGALCVG